MKQINMAKLGKAIKKRRNGRFTLRDFATQVGITHVHLCRIENYGSMITIDTLNSICKVLEVSPATLIGESIVEH